MTYLGLVSIFTAVAVVFLLVAAAARRPDRSWWAATALAALVLCVLTAVFDSLMIAVDLFRFDEDALLGVYVGLAPVEDFSWPIAAVAVVSAVDLLARPRPGAGADEVAR